MALIKSISGIRGTIGGESGENLTPIDVVKFTSAFVTLITENRKREVEKAAVIVVGRDARISGAVINQLVCATLQSKGVNVIDVGLSTTPTVEIAVVKHQADGGIIITASHNPMEWNALKLLNNKGEFISVEDGKQLLEIVENKCFNYATIDGLGSYTEYNRAIEDHINEILRLDLVDVKAIREAGFSVVFDAVNSTGGIAIPKLLEKLGVANYKALYSDPTGIFPHNPEPLPEHLYEISAIMKNAESREREADRFFGIQSEDQNPKSFDVGFVVDPDVDRLAIVMENGEMFGEEYSLVAIADYVLQYKKGNTVSNFSSSRALKEISEKYGVVYTPTSVGEVHVVKKMKETNAIIGGEGNGGIIFPELHYGRDALAGIALFLSFMATSKLKCSEIKTLYPNYIIIKNKIQLTKDMNIEEILHQIVQKYASYNPNTMDGVKIDFESGWVHLRPSNTEPIIRIYAEAPTESEAKKLQSYFLNL